VSNNASPSARTEAQYSTLLLPAIFALLLLGISATGYFYYLGLKKRIQHDSHETLAAIADLKVRQITQWMDDRRGDAEVLRAGRFLAKGVLSDARGDLRLHMTVLKQHYHYQAALLLDPNGAVTMAVGADSRHLGNRSIQLAAQAVTSGRIVFSDFQRLDELAQEEDRSKIHLDLLVPLMTDDSGKKGAVGVLLLRIDPETFLYPLVQSWPTTSRSAETLLVRAEGREVVFLNELRHQKNTALALRLPLTRADLPGAMAAQGRQGVVEGIDYRGIPVLAALRTIPGTPWSMVAKVDTEELFAPLARDGRAVLTVSLAMICFAAAAVSFIRRQQQSAARQQKRAAEKLAAANKELEAFTYSVSHDLRAPLRGVDGYAQLLQDALRDRLDDDGRFFLEQIRASARDMGQLIDDLLAFSRLGRRGMTLAQVDMAALFQATFDEILAAEPQRDLRLQIDPMPAVHGDRALLREVVRNLMGNAAKFTRTRPSACIEAGSMAHDADHGAPTFYVKDNGVGFDMQYSEKLFGVFQRLHHAQEFEGTGVGLAIVKRIVERHGGKVWAQAAPDDGAVFFFSLPSAEENRPGEETP
jgi:signal transduction histidine kinase